MTEKITPQKTKKTRKEKEKESSRSLSTAKKNPPLPITCHAIPSPTMRVNEQRRQTDKPLAHPTHHLIQPPVCHKNECHRHSNKDEVSRCSSNSRDSCNGYKLNGATKPASPPPPFSHYLA